VDDNPNMQHLRIKREQITNASGTNGRKQQLEIDAYPIAISITCTILSSIDSDFSSSARPVPSRGLSGPMAPRTKNIHTYRAVSLLILHGVIAAVVKPFLAALRKFILITY
jgi:hypothetical protein